MMLKDVPIGGLFKHLIGADLPLPAACRLREQHKVWLVWNEPAREVYVAPVADSELR